MDDSPSESNRESGVEFGTLYGELEGYTYPTTSKELVESFGDHVLHFSNGEMTLRELLEGADNNGRFESGHEVRQVIFTMVDTRAVGRKNYTDRGVGNAPDEEGKSM